MRRSILKFHAIYLGLSAIGGLIFMDFAALLYGVGPEATVIGPAPSSAIGFIEAHGLALILSALFWRAPAERAWHAAGAAAAGLLGVCNLSFWHIFVAADALRIGYITTGLHLTVAALQLGALMLALTQAGARGSMATRREMA
jgi:hypothetical protein